MARFQAMLSAHADISQMAELENETSHWLKKILRPIKQGLRLQEGFAVEAVTNKRRCNVLLCKWIVFFFTYNEQCYQD